MDSEKLQLGFAIKHYWNLCKRLYRKIDPSSKYLQDVTGNTKEQLYRMHLASCCFRIATLVETKDKSRTIYSKLINDPNCDISPDEFVFLIRDTVSHKEEEGHEKYKSRNKFLRKFTTQMVHARVGEAIYAIRKT